MESVSAGPPAPPPQEPVWSQSSPPAPLPVWSQSSPPAPLPVWSQSSPPASSSTSNNSKLFAGIGILVLLIAVGIFIWYKRKRRHAIAASPVTGLQNQKWQPNASPPTQHTIAIQQSPNTPPPASAILQSPNTPPPASASASESESVSASVSNSFGPNKPSSGTILGFSKTIFTYEELAKATNDFSEANFLGQGGFGNVFRGVLPNGEEVAIKQLKVGSEQGDREFQAEIEIISRVHHKHLVSLSGYCISGIQRLLVYQFVPNQTLKFHLHEKESPPLSWGLRMKIALSSAKGLAYLHEDCHPKIIHRDIKSANILVDYSFEAKVADFGLARLNSDNRSHITTGVMGTLGYLAPEYARTGKLTDKSDVFSFGVVLLELITGRKPIARTQANENLVEWARPLLTQALKDKKFDTIADPRLQKQYDSFEMARMVTCAATCVRHLAQRRPPMSQIVRALEAGNMSLDDLSEGIGPGDDTVYYSFHESVDYDKAQNKEDLKKMALGSQEHGASEYSGTSDSSGLKSSVFSSGQQTTSSQKWSFN